MACVYEIVFTKKVCSRYYQSTVLDIHTRSIAGAFPMALPSVSCVWKHESQDVLTGCMKSSAQMLSIQAIITKAGFSHFFAMLLMILS